MSGDVALRGPGRSAAAPSRRRLGGLQEQAEVLAHQRQREAGRALLGEQRVREVAARGRSCRPSRRRARRSAARARRPPSRRSPAPRRGAVVMIAVSMLLQSFVTCPGADVADVHDVRGEVIEHRAARAPAPRPRRRPSPPACRSRRRRRRGSPARRGTRRPWSRRRPPAAGHGGIARAEVDDQRPGRARPRARWPTASREDRRVREAAEDEVSAACARRPASRRPGRRARRAAATASALGSKTANGVAGVEQPRGHPAAHAADADEGDRSLITPPLMVSANSSLPSLIL